MDLCLKISVEYIRCRQAPAVVDWYTFQDANVYFHKMHPAELDKLPLVYIIFFFFFFGV